MASFDKYSNYKPDANVSSVVFGSEKPVLEVEVNELQEIFKLTQRDLFHTFIGDGVLDPSKITVTSTTVETPGEGDDAEPVQTPALNISVSADTVFILNGVPIFVPEVIAFSNVQNATYYLNAAEIILDSNAELKTDGYLNATTEVDNWFVDARASYETSRRCVVVWEISSTQITETTDWETKVADLSTTTPEVLRCYSMGVFKVENNNNFSMLCKTINLNSFRTQASQIIEVQLTASGWSAEAPYTQTVNVTALKNIGDDYNPILANMLPFSATEDDQKTYTKTFSIISSGVAEVDTVTGDVTFKCFKKPEADITVGLKGV